ncbi:hypothetical protein ACC691_38685, partial [Rhizobium johnstonii]|uniref:hypothetical protein n=1 Tax=Rhizobium johnstonii TaxID=3019933 RepID=UPI003F974173
MTAEITESTQATRERSHRVTPVDKRTTAKEIKAEQKRAAEAAKIAAREDTVAAKAARSGKAAPAATEPTAAARPS